MALVAVVEHHPRPGQALEPASELPAIFVEQIGGKLIDRNGDDQLGGRRNGRNGEARERGGKEALFGFFVGQTMKAMQGKANPQVINERLKAKLAG
jgi:hypothetical protein